MALTPPSDLFEWASTGTKTDPGASLKGSGWSAGDAPAADHMNYILNHNTAWIEFLVKKLQPVAGWQNVEFTTTSPFGTAALDEAYVTYNELADRWYALTVKASNAVHVYESSDGVTWTEHTTSPWVAASSYGATRITADDSKCCAAEDQNIYVSTDLTVENLPTTPTTTFAAITRVYDLFYSPYYDRFYACGHNNTNMIIERSAVGDASSGWTVVKTAAGTTGYWGIAEDSAGTMVATASGVNASVYSTNGTTFNAATTSLANAGAVWHADWMPNDCFISTSSAGNWTYTMDGGDIWTAVGPDSDTLINTPNFALAIDDTADSVYSLTSLVAGVYITNPTLVGGIDGAESAAAISDGQLTRFQGSSGTAVFLYDTDNKLGVIRYGF